MAERACARGSAEHSGMVVVSHGRRVFRALRAIRGLDDRTQRIFSFTQDRIFVCPGPSRIVVMIRLDGPSSLHWQDLCVGARDEVAPDGDVEIVMCTLEGCGSHAHMPPLVVPQADRRAFLMGLAEMPHRRRPGRSGARRGRRTASRWRWCPIPVEGGHDLLPRSPIPKADKAPALVLIHEWWGLNDQIKAVAARFARAIW